MRFPICVACGSKEDLQRHHLVTRPEGGSNDPSNLITLCTGCHFKLHARQMNGTYNASRRTKAGLAAAKARGKKLGTFGKKLAKRNATAARARDKTLRPVLKELAHLSSRAAAAEVERRSLGKVSHKTIARARVRLGLAEAFAAVAPVTKPTELARGRSSSSKSQPAATSSHAAAAGAAW